MEAISNSAVYAKESKNHLSELYYLVSSKAYLEEKNTWEPLSAVQYLRKLINLFHKNHSNKLIAIFSAIGTTPPIARQRVKFTKFFKQKQGQLANTANK